jgi:hypothetical protein
MILIISNKQDYTADYLLLELQRRQVDYIRFNTEDFPGKVQVVWKMNNSHLNGYFRFPSSRVNFDEIKSIWYRRPAYPILQGIKEAATEKFIIDESVSTLEGIWRCLKCYWVSNPDSIRKAEFKLYQLNVAQQIGFKIPSTLLTNIPSAASDFYNIQEEIIYKPISIGRLERNDTIGLIFTNPVDAAKAKRFSNVRHSPALFQKLIHKALDIRVNVIGNKVFAVEIHSQKDSQTKYDWRRGEISKIKHKLHILPSDIENLCYKLVRDLNLEFGAIDLVLTPDGEYIFLEINPNGQWAWIQQLCPDILLREALADLLINSGNNKDD